MIGLKFLKSLFNTLFPDKMEFPILEELQLALNDLGEANIIVGKQYGYCFLGLLRCWSGHRLNEM